VHQQFSKTYSHVLAPDRAYAPDGATLHRNPTLPGAAQRGVEALVDIHLLASCDYLVIDEGSTFSLLARQLSDREPSRIINMQTGWWLPHRLRHQVWAMWGEIRHLPKTMRHLRRKWREPEKFR